MKVVIQRVKKASVTVNDSQINSINSGLLIFVGINNTDTIDKTSKLIDKILKLRIFPSDKSEFDKNIVELHGEILVVSQFTLYADMRKGNRPSFSDAMSPDKAKEFYNLFIGRFRKVFPNLKEGIFGADMDVELINNGPVTLIYEI